MNIKSLKAPALVSMVSSDGTSNPLKWDSGEHWDVTEYFWDYFFPSQASPGNSLSGISKDLPTIYTYSDNPLSDFIESAPTIKTNGIKGQAKLFQETPKSSIKQSHFIPDGPLFNADVSFNADVPFGILRYTEDTPITNVEEVKCQLITQQAKTPLMTQRVETP